MSKLFYPTPSNRTTAAPASPATLWTLTWGLPLGFLVHLLDETLANGGFVAGVQRHIWPEYTYTRFALVNAAFLLLIVVGSTLYASRGGRWMFIPVFWLWERSWNAVWHVAWTFTWKEYSPGLLTGFVFAACLVWLLVRGRARVREYPMHNWIALSTGLVFEVGLIASLYLLS